MQHIDLEALKRGLDPGPNATRPTAPACIRFRSKPRAPFVDWLRFTLPFSVDSFAWIDDTFGGRIERKQGLLSYSNSAYLAWGGVCAWSPERPRNRIMVDLSAKALRSLDRIPRAFVGEVLNREGQFGRIDLALDDYDGNLSPEIVWQKMRRREVNTRWKTYSRVQSCSMLPDAPEGYTVYLGSRDTDTFARCYDKASQTGTPYHWVRFELELKRDRAHELAGRIARGTIDLLGLFLYLIRFVDPSDVSRRERWKTSAWWTDFLQTTETDRLYMPQYEIGLEDVRQWLHNQTAAALVTMAKTYGAEGVQEILEAGEEKFARNKRYQKMVKDYESQNLVKD